MTEVTRGVIGTDQNGDQRVIREFEGTHEERLAFDAVGENLSENSEWFETDTFKLFFWNREQQDWVTKGVSNG